MNITLWLQNYRNILIVGCSLIFGTVIACAPQGERISVAEKKLQAWHGKSVDDLIQDPEWGYPPDELLQEKDHFIYVYEKSKSTSASMASGGIARFQQSCTVRFVIKEDKIIKTIVEGKKGCLK